MPNAREPDFPRERTLVTPRGLCRERTHIHNQHSHFLFLNFYIFYLKNDDDDEKKKKKKKKKN
jgi:hypothetical protein